MVTFAELWDQWPWKPIRNCPGRYVLSRECSHLTFNLLLSEMIDAPLYHSARAQDPVYVVRLEDGGLISYLRSDGGLIHTLNTWEGFQRKLQHLGIEKDVLQL